MQPCLKCQQFNLPHLTHCASCGALIDWSQVELVCEPPRATEWSKRVRRWGKPFRPLVDLIHLSMDVAGCVIGYGDRDGLKVFLVGMIPGLSQFLGGNRFSGLGLLGGYMALCGATLMTLTTSLSWFATFGAVGLHVYSLRRVPGLEKNRQGTLWQLPSPVATLLLWCLVGLVMSLYYVPIGISSAATPAPLRQRDAVIVKRISSSNEFPRPGDLICYWTRDRVIQNSEQSLISRTNYRFSGHQIDRVLAVEGQTVAWNGQELLVDNEVSPWSNELAARKPILRNRIVPKGTCLIGYFNVSPASGSELGSIYHDGDAFIPVNEIRGKVIFRYFPWTRIGPIPEIDLDAGRTGPEH